MSWFGWGRSDAEKEAQEQLEVAELKEMLKRPTDLVPKGEYVRLEMAQHNRKKAADMRRFKAESQRLIEQNKQAEIQRKKEIVEGIGGEAEREGDAWRMRRHDCPACRAALQFAAAQAPCREQVAPYAAVGG